MKTCRIKGAILASKGASSIVTLTGAVLGVSGGWRRGVDVGEVELYEWSGHLEATVKGQRAKS